MSTYTEQHMIRMTPQEKALLKAYSQESGIPVSDIIRLAVADWLKRTKNGKRPEAPVQKSRRPFAPCGRQSQN